MARAGITKTYRRPGENLIKISSGQGQALVRFETKLDSSQQDLYRTNNPTTYIPFLRRPKQTALRRELTLARDQHSPNIKTHHGKYTVEGKQSLTL